jgi:hypothetical protein
VTDEGKAPTEKWIADKGAKYAYAYDKGGKLSRAVGVTGIPHALLIDPSGVVVWEGGPGSLTDAMVEQYLAGSLAKPLWEWPKSAAPIRKEVAKRQYGKAIEAADKLAQGGDAEATSIRDSLRAIVDTRAQSLKKLVDAGDFLRANDAATAIKKECAGLPAAVEATAALDRIAGDDEAKRVIKGQQQVRKLTEEKIQSEKDVAEVLKKADAIAKQYAGTAAERDARAFADDLRERTSKG